MTSSQDAPTGPAPTATLSRRRLLQSLGAAAVLPAAGGLAGCSSGSSSAGGNRKLTFVYLGSATQQAAVKAEYAGFVTANPKVAFTAQGIAATSWAAFADTLATRIAGGSAPDVIDIATEGLGIFRSKDLVTQLDSYTSKDKSSIDEYYGELEPNYKRVSDKYSNPGGKTFYIPGGFNTVCLYCNTDVFKRAGVTLPDAGGWTWDDFAAAAKQIKAKTGAYILPFGNAQFTDIMPWLLSNGASTLDSSWTKPAINSPGNWSGLCLSEYGV